jgi:hypothetical protein
MISEFLFTNPDAQLPEHPDTQLAYHLHVILIQDVFPHDHH